MGAFGKVEKEAGNSALLTTSAPFVQSGSSFTQRSRFIVYTGRWVILIVRTSKRPRK